MRIDPTKNSVEPSSSVKRRGWLARHARLLATLTSTLALVAVIFVITARSGRQPKQVARKTSSRRAASLSYEASKAPTNPHHARVATFVEPTVEPSVENETGADDAHDFIVTAELAAHPEAWRLQPGQRVRPVAERQLVVIPADGLDIAVEGLRFENLDFRYSDERPSPENEEAPAMLRLAAAHAEFHACSFLSTRTADERPTGIVWRSAATQRDAVASSTLTFKNCDLSGLDAAIALDVQGTASLSFQNTLLLGSSALVKLEQPRAADALLTIRLAHVTLRQCAAALEYEYEAPEESNEGNLAEEKHENGHFGPVTILAIDSVIAPSPGGSLVRFVGAGCDQALWNSVAWKGQGSLLAPEAAVGLWRSPDAPPKTLDDAWKNVAGLTRGAFDFAGGTTSGPAGQVLSNWQTPARGERSPGIERSFDNRSP